MAEITVNPKMGETSADQPRPIAAIDIGATAIRMTVAEIHSGGAVRALESLQKAVSLGRDVFSSGSISQETIRQCVNILSGFQRTCTEYGINDPAQIRAVGTSSIREAENRDMFLDRIYMATGITVRVIDEAEEGRLMFVALDEALKGLPEAESGAVLVADIGGGTTEILLIESGHVVFSNFFRMGTLRMRQALEAHRTPTSRVATILGQQIERVVEQIVSSLPANRISALVVTAHELQVAAQQLLPNESDARLWRLPYKSLQSFMSKILTAPVERVVSQHGIPYPEAETVGPALLVATHMARVFRAETVIVPRLSLRDGVLREMASRGYWTPAFAQEVINSAQALATKYHADIKHARQVADLALQLFDALKAEHRLSDRHRVLLEAAALLHEVGGFISSRSHHKHSMYLILNSDLFGLTHEDLTLVAVTARYHRRATPKPTHPEYTALSRDDRMAVAKMAALLRAADALDRNHAQQVRDISMEVSGDRLVMAIRGVEDLTVERLAMKEKGNLLTQVFGLTVELREVRMPAEGGA